MTKYSQQFIRLVFAISVLLLILNFLFLVRNLHEYRDDQKWINHTNNVKLQIAKTLLIINQNESNQREYIISGDQTYLNNVKKFTLQNSANINELIKITSDNQTQLNNVKQLSALIDQRILSLSKGINTNENQGKEAAETYIKQGLGKKLMVQIDNKSTQMTNIENDLLQKRIIASEQRYNNIILSSAIGFITTIFSIIIGYYLVLVELKRRREIEQMKDEFISMASHELKTPITSIKMYLDIAKRKASNHNTNFTILEKIDGQINRLTKLVSDLLDISRIQTGKIRIEPSVFQLKDIVVEVADALQQTTDKHTLTIKGSNKIDVYADRYRTYQIIMNLLSNAIKYSPDGGPIAISLQKTEQFAEVSVKDKGIGIDKIHQERIFERLYQVNDAKVQTFPGLGIGLYITSEMVRMQGGTMKVKSEKDIGSTFIFTLPLSSK
jgi:signal transduction histidine kinase